MIRGSQGCGGDGDGWAPLAHRANLLDLHPLWISSLPCLPITLPVFPSIFYKHACIYLMVRFSGEPRYIFVLVLFGLKLCHGKLLNAKVH